MLSEAFSSYDGKSGDEEEDRRWWSGRGRIEELDETGESMCRWESETRLMIVRVDAKRAQVGAGARILFYLTLLYNVFRNKIQAVSMVGSD
nr:putative dual specificity protein phosphatase DSP8 [Ipomoea batatas]